MPTKPEVGTYELRDLAQGGFALQQLRRELLVQQRPSSSGMIHLGCGFDHGSWAIAIRALNWRDAVGKRFPRAPPIGRSSGHRTEVNMARRREIIHAVGPAFGVFPSVDLLEKRIEYIRQN